MGVVEALSLLVVVVISGHYVGRRGGRQEKGVVSPLRVFDAPAGAVVSVSNGRVLFRALLCVSSRVALGR